MALSPRPTDVQALEEGSPPRNDWEAALQHVRENPALWAAAVGFIVVCALGGLFYRMQSARAEESATAAFARALQEEETIDRAAALKVLTEKKTPVTPETLYLHGETAIEAGETDAAEVSFERLRSEYPDFAFTPDAVEGLGFIAEEKDDTDGAIQHYRDIQESWPDSFTARRQPFNVARVQEEAGRMEDAIASYREQLEVFPGSNIAARAQGALDRLRTSHADLFDDVQSGESANVIESLEQSLVDSGTSDEDEPLPPPVEAENPES